MMERMLKRVGLQSSKKVLDTEKQQPAETEAATSSNSVDKDVATDDRKSPESGELQWCDLLSFRNVCAVGTADSSSGCSAGSLGNQLENDNTVVHRSRRSRVFSFHYLDLHIMEFKPRAITRRLCGGKKPDNELYRSNSFKFERFERIDDAASLQKQVQNFSLN
ncbi:hypothetical protein L9F63_021350 [Diploptera punctata]|uniref:Uncharacterized protein n=1 Tax=Diploptera punctata TaxID=6984 RepID=A0AAD7ZP36_DIPPU|nr:hypothetical protein L9F63_021350 [Diploptera punctata]